MIPLFGGSPERAALIAACVFIVVSIAGIDLSAIAAMLPGLGLVLPWGTPVRPPVWELALAVTGIANVFGLWYVGLSARYLLHHDQEEPA